MAATITPDSSNAAQAACLRPIGSPRLQARPTRIVAAELSPMWIMKVTEMICSAMPWAANSSVPIQPIKIIVAMNSPASDTSVTAIGAPRRNTCPKAWGSGRQKRANSA